MRSWCRHGTHWVYKSDPHSGAGHSCFIERHEGSGWAGTDGNGEDGGFRTAAAAMAEGEQRYPQALVVCPTRELCMQIVNEIELFKKFMSGMHVVAVYGGASIGMQIRDMKRGVQIVVATPGRLIDLIERKAINLEQIKYVVLDEADEMLNMGFQDDIEFILQNTPKREATWLFSATMPPEIRRVSKKYMKIADGDHGWQNEYGQ